jgi:hypothetical protein
VTPLSGLRTHSSGSIAPRCPAYLVAFNVTGVWKVDDGRKVVHMGATEATLKEVVCQQGADVGLASTSPAVQGEDQRLGGGWVLHKGLQRLHH